MPHNVGDTYFAFGHQTGTLTASAGSQLLVPESLERKAVEIMNDTPSPIFLRFGEGGANSSVYTIRIPAYVSWAPEKPVMTASIHVGCGGTSGSVRWYQV